jgi:hypothetical protein
LPDRFLLRDDGENVNQKVVDTTNAASL